MCILKKAKEQEDKPTSRNSFNGWYIHSPEEAQRYSIVPQTGIVIGAYLPLKMLLQWGLPETEKV